MGGCALKRSRKTLGYRLFGLGRFPRRLRPACTASPARVFDEGVPVTITLQGFRAPGRRAAWRRRIGAGSILLTGERLVVCQYRWPILNVDLDDPRIAAVEASSPRVGELLLRFAAENILDTATGRIHIRVRTEFAAQVVARLARCASLL